MTKEEFEKEADTPCTKCIFKGKCPSENKEEVYKICKEIGGQKMTKEELKQEAEEYALEKCKECYMCNSEENGERLYCAKFESRKEGYIAGAESREKCIADLEEKLANADYQLEGRDNEIRELKAQIEKTKCCGNCAKNGHICVAEEMQGKLCGKNKDKWELRR
jgi:hypothetical protein